jgi:hypothetical protein
MFIIVSCSPKSQSFEQRIIFSTTSLVKKQHQRLMGVTALTTTLVSAVNNSVAAAVSIGAKLMVRYYAQSPARTMLSVATIICREGVKLRINAWINKKWRKRRERIVGSIRMSLSKTFKWPKTRGRTQATCAEEGDEVMAIDAALRYQRLAEQRLEVARKSFELAQIELINAERGLDEAKKYLKSVRSKTPEIRRCKSSSDIVFVDYPK